MDLSVGADDVEGLTLVTAPGAIINGAIVSDTGEPFDFRAAAAADRGAAGIAGCARRSAGRRGGSRVGDDWSFSLRNITDAVLIRAQPPQGWAMKSVFINGQDITDTPMEFPRGTDRQRHADRADEEDHVAGRAGHRFTRQPGPRRDRRRVPRRREAVDLPVAIHQGGAARSGRQVSRDRASRPGAATWWSRCRASRTARPAIPSSSRRSRSWPRGSNLARANRSRLTLNCQQRSESARCTLDTDRVYEMLQAVR